MDLYSMTPLLIKMLQLGSTASCAAELTGLSRPFVYTIAEKHGIELQESIRFRLGAQFFLSNENLIEGAKWFRCWKPYAKREMDQLEFISALCQTYEIYSYLSCTPLNFSPCACISLRINSGHYQAFVCPTTQLEYVSNYPADRPIWIPIQPNAAKPSRKTYAANA